MTHGRTHDRDRGRGFIGSHLVNELADSGQHVRVVERPGAAISHLPPTVEVFFADIRDRGALERAFAGARWVYHLAANPNLWVRDRGEFDAVNYRGTVNVLDAALRPAPNGCCTPAPRAF